MNNAELFGRVLKVNVAKPSAAVGGHRPGARLSPLLRPPSHTRPTRAVRACASAVWESQADTYYKDKKEEGDGGDAEGETGTS